MRKLSVLRLAPAIVLTFGSLACSDSNEVTGSSRASANLLVSAPAVVRAGDEFQLRIELQSLRGDIRNAQVDVLVPSQFFLLDTESTNWSSSLTRMLRFSSGRFTWSVADFGPSTRPFVSLPILAYLPAGQGATPTSIEATLRGVTYGGGDVAAQAGITVIP